MQYKERKTNTDFKEAKLLKSIIKDRKTFLLKTPLTKRQLFLIL